MQHLPSESDSYPHVHSIAAVLIHGQEVLWVQRGPSMNHLGKWELPGGKLEPGEDHAAALARELEEELGINHPAQKQLPAVDFFTGHKHLHISPMLCELDASLPKPTLTLVEHAAAQWISLPQAEALEMLDSDRAILGALMAAGVPTH